MATSFVNTTLPAQKFPQLTAPSLARDIRRVLSLLLVAAFCYPTTVHLDFL